MPRRKIPKAQPVSTFTFQLHGTEFVAEIWNNFADEGTRGAHTRLKRGKVFDAVLKYCDDALNSNSNIYKGTVTRLIHGPDSLIKFGKIIVTIAKTERLVIGKTLSEEIAAEVRFTYQCIEAALAEKAKEFEKENAPNPHESL